MVVGRLIDDRAPNYLKQAIGWSYHAPYAGHDGIQLAIGQVFDSNNDHLYPYYRDMLTALSAGMTAKISFLMASLKLPTRQAEADICRIILPKLN
jgi:2-oxoisovalerate dehydrogenase E1 component